MERLSRKAGSGRAKKLRPTQGTYSERTVIRFLDLTEEKDLAPGLTEVSMDVVVK